MDYIIYKLEFKTPVHFGKGMLNSTSFSFSADTLFSALCIEAQTQMEDGAKKLSEMVKEDSLLLSDAMPYIGNKYYLPKPIMTITSDEQGDSRAKKLFKKLSYISIDSFSNYLAGKLDVENELDTFSMGNLVVKTQVKVNAHADSEPYNVGTFSFDEGKGLYFIIGYNSKKDLLFIDSLMKGLSYTGIGGKISSGFGKFSIRCSNVPEKLKTALQNDYSRYMSLSVSLPSEDELQNSLKDATYSLIKRSGFVQSSSYSDTQLRKKDLYVLKAGSCFSSRFKGDVYDVSKSGAHPVYRYAKPMFVGVK